MIMQGLESGTFKMEVTKEALPIYHTRARCCRPVSNLVLREFSWEFVHAQLDNYVVRLDKNINMCFDLILTFSLTAETSRAFHSLPEMDLE